MSVSTQFSILVVEDEPLLREAVADELSLGGFSVLEADCGAAALALIRSQRFDAVLSDVRMPNGDGISLVKAVRSMGGAMPKLFLMTAFSQLDERAACELGIEKIFDKPLRLDQVRREVAASLQRALPEPNVGGPNAAVAARRAD